MKRKAHTEPAGIARRLIALSPKSLTCAIALVLVAGMAATPGAQAAFIVAGDVEANLGTSNPATWTKSNSVFIGDTSTTNPGSLTINGGSTALSDQIYIGYSADVTGTAVVTDPGSAWDAYGSMDVGFYGTGSLAILDGASVTSVTTSNAPLFVGYEAGSVGIMTVDGAGSNWTGGTSSKTTIGQSGSGTLMITNGGSVTTTGAGTIGNSAGSTGTVTVDGTGSQWNITNSGSLTVGSSGKGTLSISDGGAVACAASASVNSTSTLTVDLGKGSSLTVGGGTGTLTNAGTIRLVAGAGAAAGTYTPVTAGTWTNTGAIQALGGVLNSNHSVTVNAAVTGLIGAGASLDLSTAQRVLLSDPVSGNGMVGAGFMAATSSTPVTFNASAITNTTELSALQGILGNGQSVLSDWTFNGTSVGVSSTNPVYLSLFAGSGQSITNDLEIWEFNGTSWSSFAANDLAYDGTFANFTTTSLQDFAVTGEATPTPIPSALLLLGPGLAGLAFMRRRIFNA